MKYEFRDNAQKIIAAIDGEAGHVQIIEPGHKDWASALYANPSPFIAPKEPDPIAVARSKMRCSPAQMRLALHRSGLLARVQGIADSDIEASIVWEYATVIRRTSPFIAAFQDQAEMSDDEIDKLFFDAMRL